MLAAVILRVIPGAMSMWVLIWRETPVPSRLGIRVSVTFSIMWTLSLDS